LPGKPYSQRANAILSINSMRKDKRGRAMRQEGPENQPLKIIFKIAANMRITACAPQWLRLYMGHQQRSD
jgi:hypothetical protein